MKESLRTGAKETNSFSLHSLPLPPFEGMKRKAVLNGERVVEEAREERALC